MPTVFFGSDPVPQQPLKVGRPRRDRAKNKAQRTARKRRR